LQLTVLPLIVLERGELSLKHATNKSTITMKQLYSQKNNKKTQKKTEVIS